MSSSLLASTLCGREARAEAPAVQACIDAHATGQVSRSHGSLVQARNEFASCAVESCPQVIREDCTQFGAEVEAALPSVVIVAQSPAGRDFASATVKIDGSADALPVDGRAVFVDPGQHAFTVSAPDGSQASVATLVRESEKGRRIVVQLAPPTPVSSEAPITVERRTPSPLVYVLGGVGLLAAGSFTYFGLDGRSRENDLKACAPACDPAEVSEMRRSYLVSDVSLGVAVASLGLGAFFLVRPAAATQPNHLALRAVSLSTSPDLGGVRVSASGAF